jgi:hypothetical protein
VSSIPRPPNEFDGSLSGLYDGWAKNTLVASEIVEEFHHRLSEYLETADPVFLVRMVKGTIRGKTVRTKADIRLRATDNAPSWWIHRELFFGRLPNRNSFEQFIESVPCHMFDIPKGENASQAGWHVAHIFDAKNGDVGYENWDRAEVRRRMVRNIHPCNYFYIPKQNWQRYGGDPAVIAFFSEKFSSRYESIWPDFLRLVEGTTPPVPSDASEFRVTYGSGTPPPSGSLSRGGQTKNAVDGCAACYSYSRLCFKADVIEPLKMDDRFCVVTKVGTFAFTKRDFYNVFPRVVESDSYQHKRIYHFPTPPSRALQFRVDAVEGTVGEPL